MGAGGPMRPVALLLVVAACSGGDDLGRRDCERALQATCNHQVSCELSFDYQSCDRDMRELYICDESMTKEQYDACVVAEPPCTEAVAEECFEVFCAASIGCIQTSTGGTETAI
jgi:hypothetical protein